MTPNGAVQRIPFNLVDENFVNVEDPSQPSTVQIEAELSTALDDDRLRAAVQSAMAVHPIARARLEPWADSARGYEWLIEPEAQIDPVRVVSVDDDGAVDAIRSELQSRPVSLFESPPLRVRLVHRPGGDVVMVAWHHAASDGVGARRFLLSVLRSYLGKGDPVPDIDVAGAHDRATPDRGPSWSEGAEIARMELQRMGRSMTPPARLTPDGEADHPGYGIHTRALPLAPIVGSALRRRLGATVNDVLIAALARAAGRWIDEHGHQAGRVSVHMPINGRPPEWSDEVVRNLVASDAVSTSRSERADVEACLAAVAGWTEAVKKRGPGLMLAALGNAPLGSVGARRTASKWAVRVGGPLADTAILSNLGRLPEAWRELDELGLTGVWFSPPAPMPVGLGLGAAAVNDRMCLSFRHVHTLWSSEAAARFATTVEDELAEIAR